MTYKVPEELFNKIANVLGQLQYNQVGQLMAELAEVAKQNPELTKQNAKKDDKAGE